MLIFKTPVQNRKIIPSDEIVCDTELLCKVFQNMLEYLRSLLLLNFQTGIVSKLIGRNFYN